MKKILKMAVVATALGVMIIPEVIYAQAGHMHRATRRRTAVVVGSTTKAAGSAQASQAQQETAAAKQQAATAEQEAAAAKKQTAAVTAAAGPLPLGTVVPTLPEGCGSTTVGGVQYYQCGGNYYRSAFQGNNLVYVTAQPK